MPHTGFVISTPAAGLFSTPRQRFTCATRPVLYRTRWRACTGAERGERARPKLGIFAALALAAGSLIGVTQPPNAQAARTEQETTAVSKDVRYDGRAELDGTEKVLSLALTGGAFAALSMWAWKRNREDDELEQIRIREEVERLEKLKAEFMNVEEDDDAIDDEDLYKELSKRLEQDANANSDENESDTDTTPNANATQVIDDSTPKTKENGTTEPAKPQSPTSNEGDESLDMLRRMWDATDDDPKKTSDDNKNKN